MKVDRIDHVHVVVEDIDGAADFFAELFGTSFEEVGSGDQLGLRSMVSPIGLTLVAPTGTDTPLARYIERRGQGIHSIGIRVPDIDEAVDEMVSRGIRVVNRLQSAGHEGVQFHPQDTYGVPIEIEQY